MAPFGFSRRLVPRGLALLSLWLAASAKEAQPASAREPVQVFAASSLADALAEIGSAWQQTGAGQVAFSFGASSDLARQIRAGAPADVFFSADRAQMDALEREGLVRASERGDLVANQLVVIVPSASAARVTAARDLEAFSQVALADPEAVPAGVYARRWLEGLGLWERLAPRVVPMLHVRAALAAVESENVEAGIVYRTDAARSRRARVAFEVPLSQGPRILYPVAPIAGSRNPAAAAFVAYLRSSSARATFDRHGFLAPGGY